MDDGVDDLLLAHRKLLIVRADIFIANENPARFERPVDLCNQMFQVLDVVQRAVGVDQVILLSWKFQCVKIGSLVVDMGVSSLAC